MPEHASADPTAESLWHLIEQRYGSRLDPAARAAVREDLRHIAQLVEALHTVPLSNSDEPFCVFAPYDQAGSRYAL